MEAPPENDICSICHDAFTLPCQANCSHWFCGDCILRVWHYESALQPCKCPICRRLITLIIPSETSTEQHNETEVRRVKEDIAHYNRRFGGGSRSLTQRLWDLPFFIRRLVGEFMDPRRSLPLFLRARMILTCGGPCRTPCYTTKRIVNIKLDKVVLSIVYFISPVDIVPEVIFGPLGFLDDLLLLLVVFLHIAALYRSVLLLRHGN